MSNSEEGLAKKEFLEFIDSLTENEKKSSNLLSMLSNLGERLRVRDSP